MRRKDREVSGWDNIRKILDSSNVLTLSLFDGDYPYSVPLHYGYSFKEGEIVFYMHSAKEGKKIDAIRQNSRAAIEIHTKTEIVPGESPSSYSSLYSSVLGQGNVYIVEEEEEKREGLEAMMRHITGKSFVFTRDDVKNVMVLKFIPASLTGKAKTK